MNARHYRQKRQLSQPATASVARDKAGALLDNVGATGAVVTTLDVQSEIGDVYDIDVPVAQSFSISAGSAGIFVLAGASGTAGQKLVNSGAGSGESCQIVCVGAGPTFRVRNLVGSHWSLV